MSGAQSHLASNFTSSDGRAQLLVHPHGVLCTVPQPDELEAYLSRRLPRRVWARDPGDVFVVTSPWCWLLVGAIALAWPDPEIGHIESLHTPKSAGREAA